MRGFKRVLLIVAVLVIAVAVLGFVLENQNTVSLRFLGWETGQLPVAVFVVIALIVGMLTGPLIRALFYYSGRRKAASKFADRV